MMMSDYAVKFYNELNREQIYLRQKDLTITVPNSVTVIGLGGVGSWTALNMALIGTKEIHLIDHDIIEPHNLNRTPFKLSQINMSKVEATAELIYERRDDINIHTYPKKFEELTEFELEEIKKTDIVIDCRDSIEPLPKDIQRKTKITGGYDGFSVTIHVNPKYNDIFGDEPVRYTVTPSYLVPPQFIANIITLYLTADNIQTDKEIIKTFDIRGLITEFIYP